MIIKAISLWEPWASLIRAGSKKYETRHWQTYYRGPLLICAAKGRRELLKEVLYDPTFQAGLTPSIIGPSVGKTILFVTPDMLYHGQAVAIVDLVDCIPTATMTTEQIGTDAPFGNFQPGRFAWKLENLRAIEPFAVKGRQGLFNVEVSDELLKIEGV
jgi:activating signal cointegrator 1